MKQSSGFIFLMTLFTISVISLLLLTCMQHILLYYKAINQLEGTHQRFYQLETLAMQLANAKSTKLDPHCVLHQDSANQIMRRLTRHEGCLLVLGSHQYRYFIEELNDYPCLIAQINQKFVSTHHRRISLLSIGDNLPDSLMQLRQISAIEALPCHEIKHKISLGISSWRYVAAI